MLRQVLFLLLPALLVLSLASDAPSQPPPYAGPGAGELDGNYVNTSNGGECSIHREGGSYVFVNENGSSARFVVDGLGRLRLVEGEWDRRTRATVQGRDRFGRMVIRFDSTGRPGFWVQSN